MKVYNKENFSSQRMYNKENFSSQRMKLQIIFFNQKNFQNNFEPRGCFIFSRLIIVEIFKKMSQGDRSSKIKT